MFSQNNPLLLWSKHLNMPRSLFILTILLFNYFGQSSLAQLPLSVNTIPQELLKNADVVIRNHNEIISFNSIKELKQEIETSVTVMNNDASYYLNHILDYKSSSEKVKIKSIEFYDKNGRSIKKIKKRDIQDISSYDGYSMISDERRKIITFQPTSYPISIKYHYEITSSNTLHIPPFIPIRNYNVSIENSHYKLVNNTDIVVASKNYNFKGKNIEKISDYEFELTNQPAISKENFSPIFLEIFPNTFFRAERFNYEGHEGEFRNWSDYGNWINESFLLTQNNLKKEDLPNELKFIFDSNIEDADKVDRLYKYIQQNTRYILINLEDGGLKPMKSGDVNDLKYGDCKALSFYMYSILNLVDIPVKYGVVYAESSHQISMDESFPNPYQANHIIINIPLENNDIWLDCTSGTNPFNFLGGFTDNRKVLLVNNKETDIRKTPIYGKTLNKITYKHIVDYSNNIINIEKENNGLQMSYPTYLQKVDVKKRNEKIIDNYISNIKSAKVLNYEYIENKNELNSIETLQISSNYIVEEIGEYTLLPNSISSFDIPDLGKKKQREHPIIITRTSIQEETIKIEIPCDFQLTEVLENISFETEYGTYNTTYKRDGNIIIIQRTIEIVNNTYSSEKYKEIKSFFNKIEKDLKRKISIKKT